MVADGRRLLRAGMLACVVFLSVGGGIGFAVAAGQGGEDLSVPLPRPGDRATYSVSKQLLPDLQLGGWGDIRLDEVVYEWLPERTVMDRSFVDRRSHPLQVTYVFRWDGNEARYTKVADHDAVTGEPFHTSMTRETTARTYLLPGLVGQGPLDQVLQPPAQVWTSSDYYAWFMAVPCAQRSALHGAAELPSQVDLGSCGWPALHDPVFHPVGWEDLPSGRAYRFQGDTSPLLNAWYTTGSPFPARFAAPMREIVDPAWTIGRLFTLERTAWARGPVDYPAPPAPAEGQAEPAPTTAAPAGHPVPLVPVTQPWALDDAGLGGELPLAVAYAEAERAPRTGSGHGTDALLGLYRPQPSVREWLAAHPEGYLAEADRFEDVDRYGNANPGWALLWVDGDGTSWLGKVVGLESSAGDESVVYLPGAAPKRLRVSDWTPSPTMGIEEYVARFPRKHQLPAALPSATGTAERFLASHPGGDITYYGFRWTCEGLSCGSAGAFVWAGRSTSTFDPNTGAMGGNAITQGLTVDEDGLALGRYHQRRDAEPVLGLGAPSAEETPPAAASQGASRLWAPPASPAATAGVGLLAVLAGALYYFWPALKGLPLAGLFSRLREDRLLEHPVRRRIHDAVQGEPGIHFQELARRVAVGNGALDHHLHKLVAASLLTVRKAPGYTCYFPKATDRRMMDAAPSLRSGGSRLVLDAVAQRPGASSRDLASHLGLAPSTVSYHLKRLETAGLVLPDVRAGVRLTPLGEQAKAAA